MCTQPQVPAHESREGRGALSAFTLQTAAILVLVLCLAAALRFWGGIRSEYFWLDEEYSRQWIVTAAGPADVVDRCAEDWHPPLYYVGLYYWARSFGQSDYALRTWSATIGLLAVAIAFVVGRSIGGDGVGLGLAFLLAVSGRNIYISQDLRHYVLLPALSISLFGLLHAWLRSGKHSALWGMVAVLVLGLYTHNYFLFLGAGIGVVLLVRTIKGAQGWDTLLAFALVVGTLYAPCALVVSEQLARGMPSYLSEARPTAGTLVCDLGLFFSVGRFPVYLVVATIWSLYVGLWLITVSEETRSSFSALFIIPLVLAFGVTARSGGWSSKSLVGVFSLGFIPVACLLWRGGGGLAVRKAFFVTFCLGMFASGLYIWHPAVRGSRSKPDWAAVGSTLQPVIDEAPGGVVFSCPMVDSLLVHYVPGIREDQIIAIDRSIAEAARPEILRKLYACSSLVAPYPRRVALVTYHTSETAQSNLVEMIEGLGYRRDVGAVVGFTQVGTWTFTCPAARDVLAAQHSNAPSEQDAVREE